MSFVPRQTRAAAKATPEKGAATKANTKPATGAAAAKKGKAGAKPRARTRTRVRGKKANPKAKPASTEEDDDDILVLEDDEVNEMEEQIDEQMADLIVVDEVNLEEGGGYDDGEGKFGPRKKEGGIKARVGRKEELFPKGVKANLIKKLKAEHVYMGVEYVVEIQDSKGGPGAQPAFFDLLTNKFFRTDKAAKKDTIDAVVEYLNSKERKKAYLAKHMPTVYAEYPEPNAVVRKDFLPAILAMVHDKNVEEVADDEKLMALPRGVHSLMGQYVKKRVGTAEPKVVVGQTLFAKKKQEVVDTINKQEHFKEDDECLMLWLGHTKALKAPVPVDGGAATIFSKTLKRMQAEFVKNFPLYENLDMAEDAILSSRVESVLQEKVEQLENPAIIGLNFIVEIYDNDAHVEKGSDPSYYSLLTNFMCGKSCGSFEVDDPVDAILRHVQDPAHIKAYLEIFFPSVIKALKDPQEMLELTDFAEVAPNFSEEEAEQFKQTANEARILRLVAQDLARNKGLGKVAGVVIGRHAFLSNRHDLALSAFRDSKKNYSEDELFLRSWVGPGVEPDLSDKYVPSIGAVIKRGKKSDSEEAMEVDSSPAAELRDPEIFPEDCVSHLQEAWDRSWANVAGPLGMEYIVEVQDLLPGKSPAPSYYCFLSKMHLCNMPGLTCEDVVDSVKRHVTSKAHRMRYLKKHFPDYEKHLEGFTREKDSTTPKKTILSLAQYLNRRADSKAPKMGVVIGKVTLEENLEEIAKKVEEMDHVVDSQEIRDEYLGKPKAKAPSSAKKSSKKSKDAASADDDAMEIEVIEETEEQKAAREEGLEAVQRLVDELNIFPLTKNDGEVENFQRTGLRHLTSKWLKEPGRVVTLADKMKIGSAAVNALDALDVLDVSLAMKVDGHEVLAKAKEEYWNKVKAKAAFAESVAEELQKQKKKPLQARKSAASNINLIKAAMNSWFTVDNELKTNALEKRIGAKLVTTSYFERFNAIVAFKVEGWQELEKEVTALSNAKSSTLRPYNIKKLTGRVWPKECKEDLHIVIRQWFASGSKNRQTEFDKKNGQGEPSLLQKYDMAMQSKERKSSQLAQSVAWVLRKHNIKVVEENNTGVKSAGGKSFEDFGVKKLKDQKMSAMCARAVKATIGKYFQLDSPRRLENLCKAWKIPDQAVRTSNKLERYDKIVQLKLSGWRDLKNEVERLLKKGKDPRAEFTREELGMPPRQEEVIVTSHGSRLVSNMPYGGGMRVEIHQGDFTRRRTKSRSPSGTRHKKRRSRSPPRGRPAPWRASSPPRRRSSFSPRRGGRRSPHRPLYDRQPVFDQRPPLFDRPPALFSQGPAMPFPAGASSFNMPQMPMPLMPRNDFLPAPPSLGGGPGNMGDDFLSPVESSVLRFLQERERLCRTMEEKKSVYLDRPESHPEYDARWEFYYKRKCQQMGRDSLPLDLITPEWAAVWKDYFKESFAKKMRDETENLRRSYRIEREDIESFKRNHRRLAENAGAFSIVGFNDSPGAPASAFNMSAPAPIPVPSARSDSFEPRKKSRDISPVKDTVFDTLNVLSALDHYLGDLASHVTARLDKARTLEALEKGSSDELLQTEDLHRLLTLVKEKLGAKMATGTLGTTAYTLVSKAVTHVATLLAKTRKPAKPSSREGSSSRSKMIDPLVRRDDSPAGRRQPEAPAQETEESKPWFTEELRNMKNAMTAAGNRMRNTGNDADKTRFYALKKEYWRMCEVTARNFEQNSHKQSSSSLMGGNPFQPIPAPAPNPFSTQQQQQGGGPFGVPAPAGHSSFSSMGVGMAPKAPSFNSGSLGGGYVPQSRMEQRGQNRFF